MTAAELLEECFDRSIDELPRGTRILETREGRDVVAHLDLGYKRVVVGRTTYTIATLSNLCTDPARRGNGYASSLVRAAHIEIRQHPMIEFAAVFAADSRLFDRLGYLRVDAAAHPDLLVAKMQDAEWPAGLIDTRGEW